MQHQTPRQTPAERARRWLLTRRHIAERHRSASASIVPRTADELLRAAGLLLIGWALAQGTLLFSVNPLAPAFLCALPQGVPFALVGALLGIWQGGYDRVLLLVGVALAPVVCFALQLLSPTDDKHPPEQQRAARRAVYARFVQRLHRFCIAGADRTLPSEQDGHAGADEIAGESTVALPPLSPTTRVLASLITALLPAVLLPLRGGFAYYDLYGALLILLLSPVATALFSFALADPARSISPVKRTVGCGALLFFVCLCIRSISVLGLLPAAVLLGFVALLSVHREGLLYALGMTLLGGIAIAPACIPPFAVAVVLYATAQRALGRLALLLGLLGGILCTLPLGGSSLFYALAPSLSVAVLLFSVARTLQQHRQHAADKQTEDYRHDPIQSELCAERARSAALIARLSAISGALSGLSEVFLRLGSHLQHPTVGELRRLCDSCFDRYCPSCPNKERCWSEEYTDMLPAVDRLADALLQHKRAEESQLPHGMRGRCPHKSMLLGDINYTWAHRLFEQQQGALTERFAHDCAITAGLLRDAMAEDRHAPTSDDESARALGRALRREGISFGLISIFGSKRTVVRIEGYSKEQSLIDGERLQKLAELTVGCALLPPRYDEEGCCHLDAKPRLQARGVYRSLPACKSAGDKESGEGNKRGAVCGDSVRLFSSTDGEYYALLCDGMGSGQAAALTSGTCVVLLERLLRAGVGIDTAMGLLNHYLVSRVGIPEQEITSTVDLLALDPYSGKAKFVKSGAADTLILRRGSLYSVSCHTLPLGILQTLDVQVVPFTLEAGDCIFMMSDGITEAGEGKTEEMCDRLYSLLVEAPPLRDDASATALLEHILTQSRALGATDDLTVAVIRIEQN